MNWEAITAISQLVSSIAVVLSVLYLGIQVHRSTRVARLATQDAAATALRDVTKPFMENAEVERIWRVGLEDLEALSVEDRARFFHATYQFLKAFETIHFHYVYGLMDRQLWEGWQDFFDIMLLRPESPIIGNFVPKFSPSGFGNSLTRSNRRRSSAR